MRSIEHEETPGNPAGEGRSDSNSWQICIRRSSDVAFEVADMASEADKVWARVVATGTQRGEWFGIPPTGRATKIEVFDICRIAGGQITEHWGLADNHGE